MTRPHIPVLHRAMVHEAKLIYLQSYSVKSRKYRVMEQKGKSGKEK